MKVVIHEQAERLVEDMIGARKGSFIFHGPQSVGKYTTALEVSRRLNCLGDKTGQCPACIQHDGGNYPDLITLDSAGKLHIQIEDVRILLQGLSLSLYYPHGVRVVVIDEAQKLTTQAQNALLKVMEEPPASTIFILISSRPKLLLPTIHSRCAHIYFPALTPDAIVPVLVDRHALSKTDARTLANLSDGAIGTAIVLADAPDATSEREQMEEMARVVVQKSLFERLLLAKRLADAKADIVRFGRLVHQRTVAQSRAGDTFIPEMPKRIEALERFRRALDQNVAPRVALERLMLEL